MIEATYGDDGWHSMDIEKIVSPEYKWDPIQVKSRSNGRYEFFRKIRQPCIVLTHFDQCVSLHGRGWKCEVSLKVRKSNQYLQHTSLAGHLQSNFPLVR
jgi:hypothetical protein